MRRALFTKNKVKFIDGTLPKPAADDPLHDAWERSNHMVVSWINRSLTTHITQSTVYFDDARSLWLDLLDRYSKGNHFRISDILQDIHSMKQGDRNVSTFFTDLKTLWEELEALRPTPVCSCNSTCTCNLSQSFQKYKDSEYVICFIKGLNDSYSAVKTQILMLEPLPSISKAFALVTQQERKNASTVSGDASPLAASSNSTNWSQQGRGYNQGRGTNQNSGGHGRGRASNNNKQCTFCGKPYHTIDTCYFKHGFPPEY